MQRLLNGNKNSITNLDNRETIKRKIRRFINRIAEWHVDIFNSLNVEYFLIRKWDFHFRFTDIKDSVFQFCAFILGHNVSHWKINYIDE